MTTRKILLYPQDRTALRAKSLAVADINWQTRQLINDLKTTLLHYPQGIGLAAPQINVHLRVILVRLGARNDRQVEPDIPIALINPEIFEAGDECKDFDGCLSFPGLYGETVRPHSLRIHAFDEAGKPFEHFYRDFDAVLIHHEIDHLDGVLFVDRIKSMDDLYRIDMDRNGKPERVPLEIDPVVRSLDSVR